MQTGLLSLLKGRMRRRLFIPGTVLLYLVFAGLVVLWNKLPIAGPLTEIAFAGLLLSLTVKWAISAVRLHDINQSGALAFPPLLLLANGIYRGYLSDDFGFPDIPFYNEPIAVGFGDRTYGGTAVLIVLAIMLLMDIVLMMAPGTKGRNRFGMPAGQPDLGPVAHF